MGGEHAGDVPSPVQELERLQSRRCLRNEFARRERRVHANEVAGQATYQRRREERLQLFAHGPTSSAITTSVETRTWAASLTSFLA